MCALYWLISKPNEYGQTNVLAHFQLKIGTVGSCKILVIAVYISMDICMENVYTTCIKHFVCSTAYAHVACL